MIRVTNIQRFCLNDGPGIRTTIFLKGCPLRCPWCSNPENISYDIERYQLEDGEAGIYGKDYTVNELLDIILKDEIYYQKDNGGVTFSGGEAMFQIKELVPLLKILHDKKINICFESSLSVPTSNIKTCLPYIDELYIDVKVLDKNIAKESINLNTDIYYSNVEYIYKSGKPFIYRIPLNNEYTFSLNNQKLIVELIKKYPPIKVEIFRIHNLGDKKYYSLNRDPKVFTKVKDEDINKFMDIVKNYSKIELIEI